MDSISASAKIAAAFHRHAGEYDHQVLVQNRVVTELEQSIAALCYTEPQRILDVGCGTGSLLKRLHTRYPGAALAGVDLAANMCLQCRQKLGGTGTVIQADAMHLPFKSGVFDLVVSSSALQWVPELSQALHEMRRVVRPQGTICLAFFCEGTLTELQSCFLDATALSGLDDSAHRARLHEFRKIDEVVAILKEMDFSRFVIRSERETDWYADVAALLHSIKNIGAGTASRGGGGGLGWRRIINETSRLYHERYEQDGIIPASYEVLYLTATAPEEPLQ